MRRSPEWLQRLRERILRWIRVDPASGCWLWTGQQDGRGYGQLAIRIPGRDFPVAHKAHRVSYWVFKRRPPKGTEIAHSFKCISPLCVNPQHLRATTRSHNERDKKRAERWRLRTLNRIEAPTKTIGVRPREKPAKHRDAAITKRESGADVPF